MFRAGLRIALPVFRDRADHLADALAGDGIGSGEGLRMWQLSRIVLFVPYCSTMSLNDWTIRWALIPYPAIWRRFMVKKSNLPSVGNSSSDSSSRWFFGRPKLSRSRYSISARQV